MFDTSAYFNSLDLSSLTGVTIHNYASLDLPNRATNIFKIARSDKSIITSAEYSAKEVRIMGRVGGTSKEEVEDRWSTLLGYCQQPNKLLGVEQADVVVQWTATLTGHSVKRFGGYLLFTLIFTASDPIGASQTGFEAVDSSGNTVASNTYAMSIGGSFKAQPYMTYTLTAVTGGTGQSVTITNAETGQGITVTRDWATSDIMNIDCDNKTIDVNGTPVEFTGSFPSFYPGPRTLEVTDTFSTRTYSINVVYNKKYA